MNPVSIIRFAFSQRPGFLHGGILWGDNGVGKLLSCGVHAVDIDVTSPLLVSPENRRIVLSIPGAVKVLSAEKGVSR